MKRAGKIVIFGAGKIGRSLIGQLFGRGGFEVVFVDVFSPIIDALNQRGNYNVIIKAEQEQVLNVPNVRGVLSSNADQVIAEIADATIMAVSVGANVMGKIAPLVAKNLLNRLEISENKPLDIILAENLRDAAPFFREKLMHYLPDNYPFDKLVGLIETSIGKMVPIMRESDVAEDILQVFAEPYNNLILDRKAFKNPIPEIEGLSPKENMKAWVDRKLFIHNLGHATTAYIGFLYNPEFIYLYEALSVPEVFNGVRQTMLQSANILLTLYPQEFTEKALVDHIDDLLSRFANKHLGDTIFRVGCDLTRKLGSEDRLVGAVRLARQLYLPYNRILVSIAAACRFKATDEKGRRMKNDLEFDELYSGNAGRIMVELSGFNKTTEMDIVQTIINLVDKIDKKGFLEIIKTN